MEDLHVHLASVAMTEPAGYMVPVWLQCFFTETGECSLSKETYPTMGPPLAIAKPEAK